MRKVDGANCAFFFDAGGAIHGQSRGHELDLSQRGGRERHFNLFKDWLNAHADRFLERLEDRYIVYGEWMQACHSVFYDDLPHLFLEFDILDLKEDRFLSTAARRELLRGLQIVSVPVLYQGEFISTGHLSSFIRRSRYKTENWRESLSKTLERENLNPERTLGKIEDLDLAEGIYGKIEQDGWVIDRSSSSGLDSSSTFRAMTRTGIPGRSFRTASRLKSTSSHSRRR